jgi:hypothetical protein
VNKTDISLLLCNLLWLFVQSLAGFVSLEISLKGEMGTLACWGISTSSNGLIGWDSVFFLAE